MQENGVLEFSVARQVLQVRLSCPWRDWVWTIHKCSHTL